MRDFDSLKNIWSNQASSPKLDYKDIIKKIKTSSKLFSNKLLLESIAMSGVIIVICLIWLANTFLLWSTHLAFIILVVSCIAYIVFQSKHYHNLNKSDKLLEKPGDYLSFLKKYQRKRYVLNTRIYSIYSIFIALAFTLLFIEIYFIVPLWQTLTGIVLSIIWFLLCAYIMKRYTQREQSKLRDMIMHLENIESQFQENQPH